MDGTKTGSTASRQIKELIDAGYLISRFDTEGKRTLYIKEINSRVKPKEDKQEKKETPEVKEPEKELPDNETIKTKEDGTTIYNRAREYWNEKGLKPECRDIIMRCSDTSEILRTFQHYTWEEIKNAIGNYAWHKQKAGSDYNDPPPYGSLNGFLKTGVERYFDDEGVDQQFKKEGKR